jgi:hypothetical protein
MSYLRPTYSNLTYQPHPSDFIRWIHISDEYCDKEKKLLVFTKNTKNSNFISNLKVPCVTEGFEIKNNLNQKTLFVVLT